MSFRKWVAVLFFAGLLASPAQSADDKAEAKREEIRRMARETLEQLYAAQPSARDSLERAAGYAVFSNFGMKLLLAGGGSGSGVAIERETKSVTYMKMAEVQAGLGWRVQKHRLVWAFADLADLKKFVDAGWDFGGQTALSAKAGETGGSAFAGAISVRPGVWLYVLTDTGLAADVTVKGTRYYRNKSLN